MMRKRIVWFFLFVVALGLVIGMKNAEKIVFLSHAIFQASSNAPVISVADLAGKNLSTQRAYWSERIKQIGGGRAVEELKAMGKLGESHKMAHVLGEVLYDELGTDGVGSCDDAFEYGCYHGFFDRAVRAKGISVIGVFNKACRAAWGARYLPCHHGIGHGVIAYAGGNYLVEALMTCKTISTEPTGGCLSGVFMGYNFQNFDHSGSVHVRSFDDANAQLPCALLPHEFVAACYGEQPQWWLAVFNNDVKKTGMLCLQAGTTEAQEACFHGIGNYVAPFAQYDVDRTIASCSQMPGRRQQAWCQEGASLIFLSQSLTRDHARDVCRGLEADDETMCVQKILSNPFWQK